MVALCRRLAADDLPHAVIDSLAGLGARVGAQTARARESNSRRAHLAGMTAARKACEELDYWLRLIRALNLTIPGDPIPPLLEEAQSLHAALAVVCAKARQRIELESGCDLRRRIAGGTGLNGELSSGEGV